MRNETVRQTGSAKTARNPVKIIPTEPLARLTPLNGFSAGADLDNVASFLTMPFIIFQDCDSIQRH